MLHNLSAQLIVDQIPAYGLGLLFAVVMIESLGVPLPGETALVATAIYAGSTHEFSIVWVVVVAAGAAIFGGIVGYCVGRTVGIRLLARFGRYVHLTEARLKVGQYLFLRHGGKIVFFGRFVAFMRVFASLLAGANRMQLPHFLAMNALGGLAWAALFGGGAYILGEEVKRLAGPVGLLLLVVAVGLVCAGIVFFRHHEKELEERAAAAFPEPLPKLGD